MKKSFKNINEEVDRIKKLFTEERLYGNLIIENIDEICNVEGTRLHKINEILNTTFSIKNIEYYKDSTSCYIYFKKEIGEYIYKFFIWEDRWFKFTKEKKDKSTFVDKLIGKTITQRISSGSYYLTLGKNNLYFNEFKTDQYKDENGKIQNIIPPIISIENKRFDIYYNSLLQIEVKELEPQLKKDYTIDNNSINDLLDGWVTTDDLNNITKIFEKHVKNNTYCDFRKFYELKNVEKLYDQISNIFGADELVATRNKMLETMNKDYPQCKK